MSESILDDNITEWNTVEEIRSIMALYRDNRRAFIRYAAIVLSGSRRFDSTVDVPYIRDVIHRLVTGENYVTEAESSSS